MNSISPKTAGFHPTLARHPSIDTIYNSKLKKNAWDLISMVRFLSLGSEINPLIALEAYGEMLSLELNSVAYILKKIISNIKTFKGPKRRHIFWETRQEIPV